jgi:endo-1,4-beta-D-glucanase Y
LSAKLGFAKEVANEDDKTKVQKLLRELVEPVQTSVSLITSSHHFDDRDPTVTNITLYVPPKAQKNTKLADLKHQLLADTLTNQLMNAESDTKKLCNEFVNEASAEIDTKKGCRYLH